MTLDLLYHNYSLDTPEGKKAFLLLAQTHWYSSVAEFDPRTAEALPQPLSKFLRRNKILQSDIIKDRLWRITDHARISLENLLRNLSKSSRREQAILPLRSVRELDTTSFMALSRRTGRNIREKLAGNPYLQAVHRFQSVDLPENRLLKVFAERLLELLELRVECLDEEPDELIAQIQGWLVSDEAKSISKWDNLPPNNTLLSHRNYRAIYDSWRLLQSLDDDINRDFSNLNERQKTMQKWKEYAKKYDTHLFAEMPVLFNYENFEIRLWTSSPIFFNKGNPIARPINPPEIEYPVCIDLTEVYPKYAYATGNNVETCAFKEKAYPKPFIWQCWENNEESVDIELFNSDAVYLHPNANSVSSTDLFFATKEKEAYLERAAFSFTNQLRKTFKNDTLIWLCPDSINDFEIEIIRRNLNGGFSNAEPLPRSVAAVFENIKYNKLNKKFSVVVVDYIGGVLCATKLQVNYDEKLEENLPLTKGFYWERQPPVILSKKNDESERSNNLSEFVIVNSQGEWIDAKPHIQTEFISNDILFKDNRFGNVDRIINISKTPVLGGIYLHKLQKRIGNIPLWRDQIPELATKCRLNDGRYKRFPLVLRGTTIKPIRGESVKIPVQKTFRLPAGKAFYKLPLFMGENDNEIDYSAKLVSPCLPLKVDLECKLDLRFNYGADDPYTLIFMPIDSSIPPIRVKWQKTEEEVITNAPAPGYPRPLTWEELQNQTNPKNGKKSNLLQWALNAINMLDNLLYIIPNKKVNGEGKHLKKFDNELIKDIVIKIHKRLYFPIIQIWNDSRSITDPKAPLYFKNKMLIRIKYLTKLLKEEEIPSQIKFEILFLLSCMHKDLPEEILTENEKFFNNKMIGFALGDLSCVWQRKIFNRLLCLDKNVPLRVFAYSIWRNKNFIDNFDISDYKKLLNLLLNRLKKITLEELNKKSSIHKFSVPRHITELLELLLGLLRTRDSSRKEIKMLLQPHQKLTKDFAKQIERIIDLVIESKSTLFSRVQLGNLPHKSENDKTPDLLYALSLYLTGDDGVNAIQITGITDEDA